MKKYLIFALIAMSHIGILSCGKGESKPVEMDLRSLSSKQYKIFVDECSKEHLKDFKTSGERARKVMIGMLGLEKKPEFHGVFEVDANFNINALFLLVANTNKIKREEEFMKAFTDQMKTVAPQLKTEDQQAFFEAFTGLLLSEQAKL